jgi:hypothetical protein
VFWNISGGRFDITGQVRRNWAIFAQGIRAGLPPPPAHGSAGVRARAARSTRTGRAARGSRPHGGRKETPR